MTDYRCSCGQGLKSAVVRGRQVVYQRHYRGAVCRAPPPAGVEPSRQYKGTLKGGLKLSEDSREGRGQQAVVGRVDDVVENEEINAKKMIGEHFQNPEHFGIHISELETLNPDGVRENGPRDMSIIADMFD